jgi:hypothetical protein
MKTRFATRTLAVGLIVAAFFALQTPAAQARHWHRGWGGFYRGGFGRGFYGGGFRRGFYGGGLYNGFYPRVYGGFYRGYGGFYPRVYAGFYPRFYGGFYGGYPGYYGGYYGNYSPGYYGGMGYGYPSGYGGYGGWGYGPLCSNGGVSSYTTTLASNPAPTQYVTATPVSVVSSQALPQSKASQFQYLLANNPYSQRSPTITAPKIADRPSKDIPVHLASYQNPYRLEEPAKKLEPPPVPMF